MGHSQMLLAVAGFNDQQIDQQTQSLASGDWSRFPPGERMALNFVRKDAREPAAVTSTDVQGLVQCLGRNQALDVIWWSCHCHYLIRIANAFQLPLEEVNVFDGFRAEAKKPEPAPPGDAQIKKTVMK
jgi:hypothetical protein